VVAALLLWRADQFGAERAHRVVGTISDDLGIFKDVLDGRPTGAALGSLFAKQLLITAGAATGKVFGPSRPVADPGRPLSFIEGDVDRAAALGLGLDLGALTEAARQVGIVGALGATAVPVASLDRQEPVVEGPDVDHLRGALEASAALLAADVTKRGARSVAAGGRPDRLDVLLGLITEVES
jgi:hypothetical protein